MRKFRKKPVIVEAEQWFPGKVVEGVNDPVEGELPHHFVKTVHQQIVFLEPGDWVIREPDGRGFYPCKPDIFEDIYDLIDSDKDIPPMNIPLDGKQAVQIKYLNHRNEIAWRSVLPNKLWKGHLEWYPGQLAWFLIAEDIDKQAERHFMLDRILDVRVGMEAIIDGGG